MNAGGRINYKSTTEQEYLLENTLELLTLLG